MKKGKLRSKKKSKGKKGIPKHCYTVSDVQRAITQLTKRVNKYWEWDRELFQYADGRYKWTITIKELR